MILKELQITDLEIYKLKILELLVDAYVNSFNISSDEAKIISYEKLNLLESYISHGNAMVIVAIGEIELVGFIWLYMHKVFDEKRVHINYIAVDKTCRGKGIGKNLMQEAEKKALNAGIKTIDLTVSEWNLEALNLYDKSGFITESRYMKKKLEANEEWSLL